MPERRRQPRVDWSGGQGSPGVRLRTGQRVTPVDGCGGGLGFESSTRVAPGSALELIVSADGAHVRRGLVMHARVCRLHPTAGVVYRIGVRFVEADGVALRPGGV